MRFVKLVDSFREQPAQQPNLAFPGKPRIQNKEVAHRSPPFQDLVVFGHTPPHFDLSWSPYPESIRLNIQQTLKTRPAVLCLKPGDSIKASGPVIASRRGLFINSEDDTKNRKVF